MHQHVIQPAVGLVAHGEIQPGLLVHDALVVGEGVEAVFAVVGAHAAFAEAAEAHLTGGQVDDGVIDAAAAETAAGGNQVRGFFVGGKQVECQGVGQGVYPGYGLGQGGVGEYGEYGAEDFLLHDRVLEGYVVHDGGFDLEGGGVVGSAVDDFGRSYEGGYSVVVFFIDDLSVIGVG